MLRVMVIPRIRKIELPIRFIEVVSNPSSVTSLMLMLWAAWFALFKPEGSVIYLALTPFGSVAVWGILFFLSGLLRFSVFLIRQYFQPPIAKQQIFLTLATFGSIAVSAAWLIILVGFVSQNWRLTAVPIYGFLFLSSFIGYLGTTGVLPIRKFQNGH